MKERMKSFISGTACLLMMLFVSSCVEGFDKDEVFSGGVTNTKLDALPADSIKIAKNATGTSAVVTWPVVFGAGGYEITVYNVDDPNLPVVVLGEDSVELKDARIDGCTLSFPIADDSSYELLFKALGNDKLGNTESAVTQRAWTTLLPATVIPDGSDLKAWFDEYKLDTVDITKEKAFELEAGGSYTLSGEVDFGQIFLTLRGNKINRPTVTMTGGFKSQGGGSIIKYINFDCEGMTASMFYGFNSIPEGATLTSSAYLVENPITIMACNFRKLPQPLFYDNGKNYGVVTFTVTDCIVELTDNGRFYRNSASNGSLKDFLVKNSTVYKNNTGTDYFMQLSGQRFTNLWVAASQSYENCTFYQFDRMHNSNNFARAGMTINVKQCIFLDFLRDGAARYILPSNNVNNKVLNFANNTYWRNGAAETGNGNYDKSGTELAEDPMCADPANGDFTVGNPNTIARGIGDPRWFNN